MAEIGKKHLAGISGGIGGVSGAVVLFVFTYFVTKDTHKDDVTRVESRSAIVEQKADGNVPAWIYYAKVKELEAEIMALRERLARLEAR
jgi:hypothetical protein